MLQLLVERLLPQRFIPSTIRCLNNNLPHQNESTSTRRPPPLQRIESPRLPHHHPLPTLQRQPGIASVPRLPAQHCGRAWRWPPCVSKFGEVPEGICGKGARISLFTHTYTYTITQPEQQKSRGKRSIEYCKLFSLLRKPLAQEVKGQSKRDQNINLSFKEPDCTHMLLIIVYLLLPLASTVHELLLTQRFYRTALGIRTLIVGGFFLFYPYRFTRRRHFPSA